MKFYLKDICKNKHVESPKFDVINVWLDFYYNNKLMQNNITTISRKTKTVTSTLDNGVYFKYGYPRTFNMEFLKECALIQYPLPFLELD